MVCILEISMLFYLYYYYLGYLSEMLFYNLINFAFTVLNSLLTNWLSHSCERGKSMKVNIWGDSCGFKAWTLCERGMPNTALTRRGRWSTCYFYQFNSLICFSRRSTFPTRALNYDRRELSWKAARPNLWPPGSLSAAAILEMEAAIELFPGLSLDYSVLRFYYHHFLDYCYCLSMSFLFIFDREEVGVCEKVGAEEGGGSAPLQNVPQNFLNFFIPRGTFWLFFSSFSFYFFFISVFMSRSLRKRHQVHDSLIAYSKGEREKMCVRSVALFHEQEKRQRKGKEKRNKGKSSNYRFWSIYT